MGNITFDYTITPLEMAESMAFNLDCLGCFCWFEYGKIVAMPGSEESVLPRLEPYIRFFHKRRDLFRGAEVVADVAVLRSFPFSSLRRAEYAGLTAQVEDPLIENRACFQIIYDHQLADLRRYQVLVLAGCVAIGDREVEHIRRYVAAGGRLCVIGPLATHDEWMMPRPKPRWLSCTRRRDASRGEGGRLINIDRRWPSQRRCSPAAMSAVPVSFGCGAPSRCRDRAARPPPCPPGQLPLRRAAPGHPCRRPLAAP